MELPRIASQTSICPPNVQIFTECGKPRTPVSRRLLSVSSQPQEPQFVALPSATCYQPSRRREEARALQNLRRRLQAARLIEVNHREAVETAANRCLRRTPEEDQEELDNKQHLLQKILANRPVSMVLDISDLRTAWQESDFVTDCLCWHNVYRQRHGSPPLTMSAELCHLAQTWGNHLAHTNKFYYRNDKDIGQNLFCRPSNPLATDVTGQEVATYWYSAFRQYNYGREPDVLHINVNAGHFTQLVWRSTKYFGIGKARSRSGKMVIVAHYLPAGNISGAFEYNVPPPQPCIDYNPPSTKYIVSSSSATSGSSCNTTSSSNNNNNTT